jgi:DNA-binding transcriptional ArsR family regulator
MDEQVLRKLLEQLHSELEHTQSVDEKGREMLRALGDDIRELLARSEANQAEIERTLLDRLEESISYLEVSHPTLTATLSKLLESLSNAGI